MIFAHTAAAVFYGLFALVVLVCVVAMARREAVFDTVVGVGMFVMLAIGLCVHVHFLWRML